MIELVEDYQLVYGIRTDDPEGLFNKIRELLAKGEELNKEFKNKRDRLLNEKIDVSAFQIWFIENYCNSIKILNSNPQYQYEIAQ